MRLTQTAAPGTEVVLAWLKGGRRQELEPVRQDFVVAKRKARETCFVGAFDPISAGAESFVKSVEVAKSGGDGAFAVKVTTAKGVDWFLVGGLPDFAKDLNGSRTSRTIGPFTTDAALALVRVQGGQITHGMLAGGTGLAFEDGAVKTQYNAPDRGSHHFGGSGR